MFGSNESYAASEEPDFRKRKYQVVPDGCIWSRWNQQDRYICLSFGRFFDKAFLIPAVWWVAPDALA